MKNVSLIIAAAGKGERAGFEKNKLLFKGADGKTVLERTLFAFVKSGIIDEYVVAVSEKDEAEISAILPREVKIVLGGKTRSASVKNALAAVTGDIVLIHDGARPFVSAEIIENCANSADKFGSGIVAEESRNTVCRAENGEIAEYLGKSGLYSVQTPQGFKTELIKKAYAAAGEENFNDDGEVYAKFIAPPRIVKGSTENVKLTFKEDFKNTADGSKACGADCRGGVFGGVNRFGAENCDEAGCRDGTNGFGAEVCGEAGYRDGANGFGAKVCGEAGAPKAEHTSAGTGEYRFGTGFDCHKLVTGRKLILGGVEIPHDKGLLGHSDADVLSHAITDAIFSAAAMRDIGYHFPDTDPAYEGADSIKLLKTALKIVGEKGFFVTSVSATIMAEKPKLLKRIPEITENLAAALGLPAEKVGIAATTLEGLGFVGREEGICVSATATLVKPHK